MTGAALSERLHFRHRLCELRALEYFERPEGCVARCRNCGITWHREVTSRDSQGRPVRCLTWVEGTDNAA